MTYKNTLQLLWSHYQDKGIDTLDNILQQLSPKYNLLLTFKGLAKAIDKDSNLYYIEVNDTFNPTKVIKLYKQSTNSNTIDLHSPVEL